MKKNVLIWVIIAVVAIAIIVGGYFAFRSLTKKPNGGGGGENIIPGKGGKNSGGNSGTSGGGASDNGGTSSDSQYQALLLATQMKAGIDGISTGTKRNKIYDAFRKIDSLNLFNEVMTTYEEIAGEPFWQAVYEENLRSEIARNINEILKQNGVSASITWGDKL